MTVPHALQLERELRLELNHSTVLFNDTQAQHMIEVAIAGNPVTGRRWIAPLAAAVVIAGMLAVSVGFGGGALGPRVSPSAASAPSNSLSPTASTAPVKASLAPPPAIQSPPWPPSCGHRWSRSSRCPPPRRVGRGAGINALGSIRRGGPQGDGDGLGRGVALVGQFDGAARFLGPDERDQRVGGLDRLASHLRDDVTGLQAGLLRAAARRGAGNFGSVGQRGPQHPGSARRRDI